MSVLPPLESSKPELRVSIDTLIFVSYEHADSSANRLGVYRVAIGKLPIMWAIVQKDGRLRIYGANLQQADSIAADWCAQTIARYRHKLNQPLADMFP